MPREGLCSVEEHVLRTSRVHSSQLLLLGLSLVVWSVSGVQQVYMYM